MASTTTRYAFPYQEATDPPNGATLGQDLAEAVEDSLGDVDDRLVTLEASSLAAPRGLIAQYERTSAISGITTETGYVRIDGITVRNGYRYRVNVPECNITADATGRIGRARLRASTSGNATTSSTVIGNARTSQPTSTSETNLVSLFGTFDATGNGTLSVLWTIERASAVGSVGLFGAVGEAARIEVVELGLTPASSGTNI